MQKKASAQNRAKALKIMQFLGLVANQMKLFPLDGAGGFGGYIVNYAVYVFYLVCDTI